MRELHDHKTNPANEALTKLEEALMWLQKRTQARVARGVEGTHEV